MAKLWTYRLTAGHSVIITPGNGFKQISVSNESASTANGEITGSFTAKSITLDGSSVEVPSAAVYLEPGQPATIISCSNENDYIKVAAPTGCNLNIYASNTQ
jgi:hypothetical protein